MPRTIRCRPTTRTWSGLRQGLHRLVVQRLGELVRVSRDRPPSYPAGCLNNRHSIPSKRLSLTPGGASVVLPAQPAQTANAQADLALDNIFNHPNVGPYMASS